MVAMITTRLLFFAAMWNIASASLTLAHNDKECDITNGEIFMPSSKQASNIEQCLSSCETAPACRSVTYYASGYCSHFITRCENTAPSAGSKSYTIVEDSKQSIVGSKHLGEKCSEGAMTAPGYVFHMNFCMELCQQSVECNSITYSNTGYCYHFTSKCDKRTSMAGAVSFQVKPFSTNSAYVMTSCDKTCQKDHSKYLPKSSGYVLSLEECLESCTRNAECESMSYFYDGFCGHFGLEPRTKSSFVDRVCHVRANKCLKDNGGCDSKRPCTNMNGSVKCEDCPAGYANDGATGCKDVNECAKDNGGCDGKRACTNTDGSMSCRDCPAGYVNDGAKKSKASTSARQITAAATAIANAPTRRDPSGVNLAQLGMLTTERRAAKTSTSACRTTAAATANANAPTRWDPPSVKIAQLGMRMTERRNVKT